MLFLILFAFFAGVVTILSPCILPILPIVLSGSLVGGKRRPFGIVTGFILSFSFFTLALSAIVKATGLPADSLRILAVAMIFFFGASLVFPQTQKIIEMLFSKVANLIPTGGTADGFFSGILVGFSLGLVWAPCVGPILASVITLAVTNTITFGTILITVAYAVGSAVPMLAITYGGRQLLQKVPWLLSNTQKIQQGFGVVMMLTALAIFFNVDRQFQTFVLTAFPQYGAGLTSIEDNTRVQQELAKLRGQSPMPNVGKNTELLNTRQQAPDFTGGTTWLNSQPLSLQKELKGKVVLVDFWTYTCINCIRTLPYVKKWYETYKDQGFVVVGVHSPEFAFEKETPNVTKAIADFGITYPVVQDNDFAIWSAYQNHYWPAHYLIDSTGVIRYMHFGEGKYVETENAIRQLLNEQPISETEPAVPMMAKQTPETYLGWERATAYPHRIQTEKSFVYEGAGEPGEDEVILAGKWTVNKDSILANMDDARLRLKFLASDVYLVASGNDKEKVVSVFVDGQPIPKEWQTKDYNVDGKLVVKDSRKYDVVAIPGKVGTHLLELRFPNGSQPYVFTFGSK